MRDLHVVALSQDGRHVVLALQDGDTSEHFRVALDDRLLRAVRGEPATAVRGEPATAVRGEPARAVRAEAAPPVRADPAPPAAAAPAGISPREIQARLRDGETMEEIASDAGVPVSRVERFAWPVLAEIDRVVSGARSGFVQRARLGPSDLPLGEAVEQRLAEAAGVTPGSVQWTARRQGGGAWLVQVSWTARSRRRTAGWLHDPTSRDVVAVDGASAALGHVQHDREAVGRDSPAPRAGVRPAARDRTAPRRAAAPTSAKGAAALATVGRTGVPVTQATGQGRTPTARPTADGAAAVRGGPAGTAAVEAGPASARRSGGPAAAPASVRAAAVAAGRAVRKPAAAGGSAPGPSARDAAASPTAAAGSRAPRGRSGASTTSSPGRSAAPPAGAPVRQPPAPAASPPRPAAARRRAPVDAAGVDAAAAAPDVQHPDERTAPSRTGATRAAPPRPRGTRAAPAVASGPPLLRVVPPTEPDEPAAGRAPRRPAAQRPLARDWADVLMGGAPPRPPA